MKRIVSVFVVALLGVTMIGAPAAEAVRSAPTGMAAPSFPNCDSMHKKWPYGVAKSRKAARKQVRTGHYKPRVSRAGYRANSGLDADKDGTACEVLK
jgi:Excalibur calcium-binding domain